MTGHAAVHDVVALRYATLPHRRRGENFTFAGRHDDDPMPMDYFAWLVRGPRTVVVDTGCTRSVAEARGRTYLHDLPDLLTAEGVDAATVTDVVLTHLHYDHAGGTRWFPGATFHVQQAELEFVTGDAMRHTAISQPYEPADLAEVARLADAGRLRAHHGSVGLHDGLELHRVGGHTGGHQIVRVRTTIGWLVLASDALHFTENRTSGNPFPIVSDVVEMLDGHRRCEELADADDLVFAGHDPAVRGNPHAGPHPDRIALTPRERT